MVLGLEVLSIGEVLLQVLEVLKVLEAILLVEAVVSLIPAPRASPQGTGAECSQSTPCTSYNYQVLRIVENAARCGGCRLARG